MVSESYKHDKRYDRGVTKDTDDFLYLWYISQLRMVFLLYGGKGKTFVQLVSEALIKNGKS